MAVGVFLAVSLFLGVGGPVGGWLEEALRLLIGRAVALAPLALILIGIALILDHPLLAARPMRLGVGVGAVALVIALAGGSLGIGGVARESWFDGGLGARGGYIGELGYWATSTHGGRLRHGAARGRRVDRLGDPHLGRLPRRGRPARR